MHGVIAVQLDVLAGTRHTAEIGLKVVIAAKRQYSSRSSRPSKTPQNALYDASYTAKEVRLPRYRGEIQPRCIPE